MLTYLKITWVCFYPNLCRAAFLVCVYRIHSVRKTSFVEGRTFPALPLSPYHGKPTPAKW